MRNKIEGKINKVCDCLCRGCVQRYEGECRAYMSPHSEKESKQRKSDTPLCEIPIFRWGFRQDKTHYCYFNK